MANRKQRLSEDELLQQLDAPGGRRLSEDELLNELAPEPIPIIPPRHVKPPSPPPGFDERHPVASAALDIYQKSLGPLEEFIAGAGELGRKAGEALVPERTKPAEPGLRMDPETAAIMHRAKPGETRLVETPEEAERRAVFMETFARGALGDVGQMGAEFLADPRNWPFLLAAPAGAAAAAWRAARPSMLAAVDIGFAAFQEANAIEALMAGDLQSAAVQQAFALLGLSGAPRNVRRAFADRVRQKAQNAPELPQVPEGGITPPAQPEKAPQGPRRRQERPSERQFTTEEARARVEKLETEELGDAMDYLASKADELAEIDPGLMDALEEGMIEEALVALANRGDRRAQRILQQPKPAPKTEPELPEVPEPEPQARLIPEEPEAPPERAPLKREVEPEAIARDIERLEELALTELGPEQLSELRAEADAGGWAGTPRYADLLDTTIREARQAKVPKEKPREQLDQELQVQDAAQREEVARLRAELDRLEAERRKVEGQPPEGTAERRSPERAAALEETQNFRNWLKQEKRIDDIKTVADDQLAMLRDEFDAAQLVSRETQDIPPEPAPEPQDVVPEGPPVALVQGNEGTLRLPSKPQRARYALVEASDLQPSHDAGTFGRNPRYPENVQERMYHTDKNAQMDVIRMSSPEEFVPEIVVNTDPTPMSGPPQIRPDGVVLGGNSRTMAIQRIYGEGRGALYQKYLAERAQEFGLDPAKVSEMKEPVLVRVVEKPPGTRGELAKFASELNQGLSKGLNEVEAALSAGRKLTPKSIERLVNEITFAGETATLRHAMDANPTVFRDVLLEDGVLTPQNVSRYFYENGQINAAGRDFIENALLGRIVGDADLLTQLPRSMLSKLERSVPALVEISARTDAWNIMPQVLEAAQLAVEAQRRGWTLEKYLAQRGLFETPDPRIRAIAELLTESPTKVKNAFNRWASEARAAGGGEGLFPEAFDPNEAFTRIIEKPELPGTTLSFMGTAEIARQMRKLFRLPEPPPRQPTPVTKNVSRDPQLKWHYTFDDFYTQVVDRLHPFKIVVQEMQKLTPGRPLSPRNAYNLARLFAGWVGKADHFLYRGTFDPINLKLTGQGLKDILEPFNGRLEDLGDYLVARRALEKIKQGQRTGISAADAQATVRQFDTPEFRKAADELYRYQDELLQYVKRSGMLSEGLYNQIKALNQEYVPFYRLIEEEVPNLRRGSGAKVGDLWVPIRKFRGSERMILDPLESIIKNTYTLVNLAERNRIGTSLTRQARATPGAEAWVQPIERPTIPIGLELKEIRKTLEGLGVQLSNRELATIATIFRKSRLKPTAAGKNILSVFENGQPKYYSIHPELYKAMQAMDETTIGMFTRLFSKPAGLLRLGATGLSPEFTVRNPSRDTMTAFLQSRDGFKPGVDTLKGAFHVLKRDDLYWEWKRAGGEHAAMVAMDRTHLQSQLKDMMANPMQWAARHPIEALRMVSEAGEAATRLGEYRRVRERGGTPGEAGLASREVTLDFNRRGAATKAVNMIVAFWNATVQGTDKLVRTHLENPMETVVKGMASITLPQLLLYALNRNDPDYKELPQWQKDFFFLIPTRSFPGLHEITPFIPIPKPFLWGTIYGTVPERVMQYIDTQDPKAFDNLIEEIGQNSLPGAVPTAAIPLLEAYANKSMFTGRPLEAGYMEPLEPRHRAYPYTTEFSKVMSESLAKMKIPGVAREGIRVSPVVLDNAIFGYTAGLGRTIAQGADRFFDKGYERPTAQAADYPLIRAFMVRPVSGQAQSIRDLYEQLQILQQKDASYKFARKYPGGGASTAERLTPEERRQMNRLQANAEIIAAINRRIRRIQTSDRLSGDEKRERIDKSYRRMLRTAQRAMRTGEFAREPETEALPAIP